MERKVDTIKLFLSASKRNRRMEQRIHGVSYRPFQMSSKNVLSEWIPFDSTCLVMFIHLKENFAFGIRPSDDEAIVVHSSQLGPVHLHME